MSMLSTIKDWLFSPPQMVDDVLSDAQRRRCAPVKTKTVEVDVSNWQRPPDLDFVGPDGEPCVHILDRGVPVCGFSTRAPVDWPPGNKWVGLNDPNSLNDVTCTVCRMAVEQDKRHAEESNG